MEKKVISQHEICIGNIFFKTFDNTPYRIDSNFFASLEENIKLIRPIHIEEILLMREGFINISSNKKKYSKHNFRYSIERLTFGYCLFDEGKIIRTLQYLHELQNTWFFLTKERLIFEDPTGY